MRYHSESSDIINSIQNTKFLFSFSSNIESTVSTTSILRNSPNYFKITPNTLLASQSHTVRFQVSFGMDEQKYYKTIKYEFFVVVVVIFPPHQSFPTNTSGNNSIWSPNIFDNCSTTIAWNQMTSTSSTSNCYQNYAGYYSNIDYFNSTAQQQLVRIAVNILQNYYKFNRKINFPFSTKML